MSEDSSRKGPPPTPSFHPLLSAPRAHLPYLYPNPHQQLKPSSLNTTGPPPTYSFLTLLTNSDLRNPRDANTLHTLLLHHGPAAYLVFSLPLSALFRSLQLSDIQIYTTSDPALFNAATTSLRSSTFNPNPLQYTPSPIYLPAVQVESPSPLRL